MTASSTILSVLAKNGIPVEAQAFLASIAEGEGTIDFNTLYSGGALVDVSDAANIKMVGRLREWTGSLATFPAWHGATAAGGTISTAAGFVQITHTTWMSSPSLGVTDFEPASQIAFAWQLAKQRFVNQMGIALFTALQAHPELITTYLIKTWPGGADAGFAKRYVANMAALSAPASPPPTPETITVTLPLPSVGTDQGGRTVMIKWATTAAAVLALGLTLLCLQPAAKVPPSLKDSSFVLVPAGGAVFARVR